MNVVINENITIPDDIIQFVSESLLDVYNFTNQNIYDCVFAFEQRDNKSYYRDYVAIVENGIIKISKCREYANGWNRAFYSHGYYLNKNSLIISFTNISGIISFKDFRKNIDNLLTIRDYEGNYRIEILSTNETSQEYFKLVSLSFLEDNKLKIMTKDDALYSKFEKTVEYDGFIFKVYKYNKNGNKIRLKFSKNGSASLVAKTGDKTICKNINAPDENIIELNGFGLSKKEIYISNPIALNRMDKWTIGF